MKLAPSDFGQFFTIGRELGWDPEKWEWTVKDLVNPAGIPPKLKEITTLDPEMSLEWSGESRGPLKVRECIIESHNYDLEPENLILTHGTQHAQFLATVATVDAGATCGVGDKHPITEQLAGQFDVRSLATTCASARKLKQRLQQLHVLDGCEV